jgi:hypothetical protein
VGNQPARVVFLDDRAVVDCPHLTCSQVGGQRPEQQALNESC